MIPDEFRVNHRAASESLLHAVVSDAGIDEIRHQLDKATFFENDAVKHIATTRQRALAMGLLHTIDLIRAVTEAEFQRPEI